MKLAAEISSKTAEQRFDKLLNQLVKSAKHIYSEKATYHELTEGMRAWVLKKSDIKKAFLLTRSFFTHLNKGEHMLLSDFVRFTNWIFPHYTSGGHLFQCPQEYGRGFGLTSIKNMRSFYLMFCKLQIGQAMLDQFKLTDEPIRQAPLDESTIPFYPNLSWLHYERLLRVKDADARLWYLKEAAREQWDYRTLQRNISSQYYYRLLQTPEHLRKEVSDEMRSLTSDFEKDKLSYLKNPVIAEFLGLPQNPAYSESKLETAIIDHLQTFIMELGKGYAFVARQQHIKTDMGDFYIDLVFYNIILKSYLIIDLKTTQITHQDVGQMDMYVRMYDELKREEGNNPTIGLVLCSDTSKDLARYSILKDSKQLFAAKYLTYLPTEEELSREIREQKEFFELQKGKETEDED